MKKIALVLCSLWTLQAEARVFSFKSESFGSYLRATGGPSYVYSNPYVSSLPNTSFSDTVAYNFSGEFGFIFALGSYGSFRIGAEMVTGSLLTNIPGKSAADVDLVNITSKFSSFNPTATLEVDLFRENTQRVFLYAGAGYSQLTVDNAATLTAAGQAAYGGVPYTSYSETLESLQISYHGGAGWEVLMSDATTFVLDVGYRQMLFTEIFYKADVTMPGGTYLKGDRVLNIGGAKRDIDLSGYYLGITFRFYISG